MFLYCPINQDQWFFHWPTNQVSCFNYPPPKSFGGEIVLAFSVRTHILVMDIQILLSFYRNMNLHMRTAHLVALHQLEIELWPLLLSNIHSRQINFLSGRISWLWIFRFYYPLPKISRGKFFWCGLSVLPLSVRPTGYGLLKVDQTSIVKSLASYN